MKNRNVKTTIRVTGLGPGRDLETNGGDSISAIVRRDVADSVDLYFAPVRAAARAFGNSLKYPATVGRKVRGGNHFK